LCRLTVGGAHVTILYHLEFLASLRDLGATAMI